MATRRRGSRITFGLNGGETGYEAAFLDRLAKSQVVVEERSPQAHSPLVKSILNQLNGEPDSIERLAFEVSPTQRTDFGGVYRQKLRLIPDDVLKRIAIQDSLVSNIVRMRQNHVSSFGRPRDGRFELGYMIRPDTGIMKKMDVEEKKEFDKEIKKAVKLFETCGHTEGVPESQRQTFSEYLSLSTRTALVNGRIATEMLYVDDEAGEKHFHRFVHTDGGTIFKAGNDQAALQGVRDAMIGLKETLRGPDEEPLKEEPDPPDHDYIWVQVVEGKPVAAFTDQEMKVYNFYAVGDVELGGYPVTPIDTVISAVTTHINITQHNKLYFQSGRASRGMLVIKSDDVTPQLVHNIKQTFNASINNVNNSWRMPVFGVGQDEEVSWSAIDNAGGRDMEFQYLTDMNAREILTAFQMSPDEMPGWTYLSRGTNSQSLAECLDPAMRVTVADGGLRSLADILGDAKEKFANFWDGTRFVEGRVFRSGVKQLRETELDCGIKIRTSPDHRFRVLDAATGEPVWRHQEDLRDGDLVLVNKTPVKGSESAIPSFNGVKATPELMEVLGWMTGDGTLTTENVGGDQFRLFYHHEKERGVWDSHVGVLEALGLKVHHDEVVISPEEQDKIKARYGFKSVASSRLRNIVYGNDFCQWLVGLGFGPSHKGKTIPALVHNLPEEYRSAFLRGFFSADGGKLNKTGSVAITIHNDELRDQTRQLLMGLGIRTLGCKGLNRRSGFGGSAEKTFSPKLFIKDRAIFWDKIGFVQDHKQPDDVVERWQIGAPPQSVVSRYLSACAETQAYRDMGRGRRHRVLTVLAGRSKCSWNYLREMMVQCGVEQPDWMTNFHVEPVKEKRDLGQSIEMVDVEMFSDSHAFIVEGVMTHNSNNEYKLEAARDVGIRPLLHQFEDFVNTHIFPFIAPKLVGKARLKFVGLDADNAEKESVRLTQDMAIWETMDGVLQRVEQEPVGKEWAGEIPFNPTYWEYLNSLFTVGEIKERFCGIKDASKNPMEAYKRDQYFFQWLEYQQAQQQAQQAAANPQPAGGDGGAPGGGGDQPPPQGGQQQDDGGQAGSNPPSKTEKEKSAADDSAAGQGAGDQPQADSGGGDIARSLNEAYDALSKAEGSLPTSKRRLLAVSKHSVDHFMKEWKADAAAATAEILAAVREATAVKKN